MTPDRSLKGLRYTTFAILGKYFEFYSSFAPKNLINPSSSLLKDKVLKTCQVKLRLIEILRISLIGYKSAGLAPKNFEWMALV